MKVGSLRSVLALLSLPMTLAAQENDPPARAGRVSSVAGTVAFQAGGTPDWSAAPLNYTVTSGDRILTHQRSRAEIEVGPYDVRLSDSTDLQVVHLTDDFTQLGLTRGTIRVSVYRLASRDSMEIDTPNGAIVIRSAGRYRVDVLEGVSTIVSVEDGVAELSGPALDYTVRRGQTIELTGTSAISASLVPHPRNTEFDEWSADRDRRQESAVSTRYVSRDIPGVADLDHHGHWEHHVTYGYVWRPRIVHVGWVPYRYGRWVWSGPWGWTWVEDSPWGFAPFHYGRWVVIGNHWVWAPGPIVRRPYYAPALVVFVGGPRYGRHHQAWFPLGWHEPYYPRYRHSDRYLRQVNIAHVRNISNVDEFVDVRRADRIEYRNRQATTVVSSDAFGRRPVVHDAANFRGDEIARAPIARDRWENQPSGTRVANAPAAVDRARPTVLSRGDQGTSRVRPTVVNGGEAGTVRARPDALIRRETGAATPTSEPSRLSDPRRASEPTRVTETGRPEASEPRARAPLIFRNQPPATVDRRRVSSPDAPRTSDRSESGELRPRRPIEAAPSPAADNDRGAPLIRRNEPQRSSGRAPGVTPSAPPSRPTGTIERSPEPQRSSPPRGVSSTRPTPSREPSVRSAPSREPSVRSAPSRAPSAQSAPRSGGRTSAPAGASAPRVGTRRPGTPPG